MWRYTTIRFKWCSCTTNHGCYIWEHFAWPYWAYSSSYKSLCESCLTKQSLLLKSSSKKFHYGKSSSSHNHNGWRHPQEFIRSYQWYCEVCLWLFVWIHLRHWWGNIEAYQLWVFWACHACDRNLVVYSWCRISKIDFWPTASFNHKAVFKQHHKYH